VSESDPPEFISRLELFYFIYKYKDTNGHIVLIEFTRYSQSIKNPDT
jgi:hypothetical protein